jgi:amino acid transporter
MAIATAFTIAVISYSYSRIIEHFPSGGGGYIVASHTISPRAGVLSGSALLVDYVLTISVSIASCTDALFSFLPASFHGYKILCAVVLIVILVILNLRGLKESVLILAPIFVLFVLTHVVLLGYGVLTHANRVGPVLNEFHGSTLTWPPSDSWVLAVLLGPSRWEPARTPGWKRPRTACRS